MSLLVRTVTPSRRRFVDPNQVPGPMDVAAGSYRYVPLDALKVASVQACVGLRAGVLAQLPIKGYQDRDGVSTLLEVQPPLLADPSPTVVPSVWKTQMSISRDLWGFAVGQILAVDGAGYAARVEWFPPEVVRASRERFGEPIEWMVGGQRIDPSLVFHVPSRWVMPGDPLGVPPLKNGGLVDLAIKCQDFGRDWFAKGSVPSAILYSDTVIDSDEADRLLSKVLGRWRRRQPAILGAGMKYEQVQVAPNESQFLETMTRVAADVAICFNMPPEKIGAAIAGQSITYSNRDQSQQQYLIDSINPDLVVTQEAIGRHLPPSIYPRWSTGAFLRSDLKTRYEAARIGVDAGFLTPNEVRALEELPPLDGGDVLQPKAAPLAGAISEPAAGRSEQPPVVVHNHLPEQRADVHVQNDVHVPEQRTPDVHVHNEPPATVVDVQPVTVSVPGAEVRVENVMPAQQATVRTVVRDADGRIAQIIDEVK